MSTPKRLDASESFDAARSCAEEMMAAAHDIMNDTSGGTPYQRAKLAAIDAAYAYLVWALRDIEHATGYRTDTAGEENPAATADAEH